MKCACKGAFLDRFIQPYILLTLNRESMHGFVLYKRLIESKVIDYSGIDPTGMYRMLKKMEASGLLLSQWDTEDSAHPRKIYSISPDGKDCLKHWKKTLLSYQKQIRSLADAVSESLEETSS